MHGWWAGVLGGAQARAERVRQHLTRPRPHWAPTPITPARGNLHAMQSNLSAFHLPDVLQMLHTGHKTGSLLIRDEHGATGYMSFDAGQLVGAEYLGRTGELALYAALSAREIESVFDSSVRPSGPVILDLPAALMRYTFIHDSSVLFRVFSPAPHVTPHFLPIPGCYRIGRDRACNDVVIPHPSVSHHHAVLVCSPNGSRLYDLGSTNGTWAAGERFSGGPISVRADIRLGEVRCEMAGDARRFASTQITRARGNGNGHGAAPPAETPAPAPPLASRTLSRSHVFGPTR